MLDTINAIWDNVLRRMKNELDSNAFDTFFLPIKPKEIKNGNFIVEAPTRFVKEVLSSPKFATKINDALKDLTNTNFSLLVKETSELANEQLLESNTTKNEIKIESNLNASFTFNNFVVGPCNRECYEASMAVALDPGKFYNPLFIYGRAGIGKTHLLHAIGNYCKMNQNRTMNIMYISANDFIDEFLRSNQNKDVDAMKAKFKSIDMLLLDDVQFLAGKEKTGDVFFQIFNNIFNEKKQIVLTSDRNPNDLRGLEARLISRFASGLTVGMNAPEYETAISILKRKIDAKNFDVKNIDEEALNFIAKNYSTDVRQLEGALTRLFFFITMNKTDNITLATAMEALKNITPPKKSEKVTCDEIIKNVAEYYNLTSSSLIGNSRVANIKNARFIAMYLCRLELNMTFEDIGKAFGNRDHSTVMNACMKMEKLYNEDQAYKIVINKFQQMLTR